MAKQFSAQRMKFWNQMLYRDLLENSEVSVTRVKKIEEWAILNPLWPTN